ncbi:hypothetical protein BDP27DRAFT_1427952 [Rhodocollybia butyracea]|uniref:Uncharacterized protein n=1 Tax=Rhodocollybia butyracea TaxID=206335 RepID=A0A9P5PEI5_9AGAR|nr:hypothetical protein BDP27DRAFT_1427952 [Rhodocollybia butyracea]
MSSGLIVFLMMIVSAVSYDVDTDGVKVTVLASIKSTFRMYKGRASVVQLFAHLTTHESSLLFDIHYTQPRYNPSTKANVVHHSGFVLPTL